MIISESAVSLSVLHTATDAQFIREHAGPERRTDFRARHGQKRSLEEGENRGIQIDRVSISSGVKTDRQSFYKGQMTSKSVVKGASGGSPVEFSLGGIVEHMVGKIIDREVAVRALEKGQDVRPENNVVSEFGMPWGPSGNGTAETRVSMNRIEVNYEEEQMGFFSEGQVATGDGRRIDFSLEMSMDRAFLSRTEEKTLVHTWQEPVSLVDPLVINLNGRVPELTDTPFEFDLNNDGTAEMVSFTAAGSGFLSFDRNGDKRINNGSELFGPGTGDGFKELAAFDLDGNNWIDEHDAVFSRLSVWTLDGSGQKVLVSMKDAGIGAIYLNNAQTEFSMTDVDNQLKGQVRRSGLFLFENGKAGSMAQIDLAVQSPERAEKTKETRSASAGGRMSRFQGLVSPLFIPGQHSQTPMTTTTFGRKPESPLDALRDHIRELKETLSRILGQGSL